MQSHSNFFRLFRRISTVLPLAGALLFTTHSDAALKGSETKGRAYYRQICKDCHVKGGKGGEVSPLTKTQAQWRIYMQKATHVPGEPLSKYLNEAQMLDVQTFLINHAADSPQPETCGK
jgi:mono/diheme cytochrome c family protein